MTNVIPFSTRVFGVLTPASRCILYNRFVNCHTSYDNPRHPAISVADFRRPEFYFVSSMKKRAREPVRRPRRDRRKALPATPLSARMPARRKPRRSAKTRARAKRRREGGRAGSPRRTRAKRARSRPRARAARRPARRKSRKGLKVRARRTRRRPAFDPRAVERKWQGGRGGGAPVGGPPGAPR